VQIKATKPQQPRSQIRAPVGSLANNPEWNGIIKELEFASNQDAMSKEQYIDW